MNFFFMNIRLDNKANKENRTVFLFLKYLGLRGPSIRPGLDYRHLIIECQGGL